MMRPLPPLVLVALACLARPGYGATGEPTPKTFAAVTREIRQSVFLIGAPDAGTGTAFVISQKHRLLATNAHVADIFYMSPSRSCRAMQNETGKTWKIDRIWYHPGTRRFPLPDRSISVRSTDQSVGRVDPACPDVAIIQLSPDGPELPTALSLGRPDEFFELLAEPVAMLGFPGHDTKWPKAGGKALATFHTGVVSRAIDFRLEATSRELSQWLQYTIETFGGFSGSPVYLSSGKVIALNNASRTKKGGGLIAHGVRVDCLYELISHHGLEEMIPLPMRKDRLLVKRWLEHDPAWDLHRKLADMTAEARLLNYTKLDYRSAIAKCNEIIKILPSYSNAYDIRCDAFINLYLHNDRSWSVDKRIETLLQASDDAEKRFELLEEKDTRSFLTRAVIKNNLGRETRDRKFNREALNIAEAAIKLAKIGKSDLGSAWSAKGVALDNLGLDDDALEAHNRAVQIDPDEPAFWDNRASFFRANERYALAKYDEEKAQELRKKNLLLARTKNAHKKLAFNTTDKLTTDDKTHDGKHYKVIEVNLEEGYYYQIDLRSPLFGSGRALDPLLKLLDAKGAVIWEDDDGGGFPHSRLFFTTSRTGPYRFMVTTYARGDTGTFELSVLRIAENK